MSSPAVKHDADKARWDLLPFDALDEVALVLKYGAQKYTQHGECTCGAAIAVNLGSTQSSAAEAAMRNASALSTPPSPNDNNETLGSGPRPTQTGNEPAIGQRTSAAEPRPTDSPLKPIGASLLEGANSVAGAVSSVSTTIIKPEPSAGACASPATSASDGLKSATGANGHASTCEALRVVRRGERNWEKGIDWGRLLGAALRHLAAWANGIEVDEESGHPHLAHAACCVLMLLALVKRGQGDDDRGLT